MVARGYRLGIDFGTSTTVAVLAGPDGPAKPLLFDASPLLPSAVHARPGAEGLLTGADAERAALVDPASLELNPKRRIDDGTLWLGDRELPVSEVVAAVLARVVSEARRVAGGVPERVTLTHPASWGRTRLGVLAAAAERAGLADCAFVAEPVAAAAYFADVLGRRLPVGHCLVVYDLGAGTCDVSVVRRDRSDWTVVTSAGLDDVGGLDLDATVVGHARSVTAEHADAWGRLDWPQTPADHQARHLLWTGARAAKEQLSRHSSADLRIPLIDRVTHLTREEFERAARPHLARTVELTVRVLRDAGIDPTAVAGVFLVGGSSRVPLVASLLHRALRVAPTAIDHPEIVVAEGALHVRTGPTTGASGPAAGSGQPAAGPPEPATGSGRPAAGPPEPAIGPPDTPGAVVRLVRSRRHAIGTGVAAVAVLAVLGVLAAVVGPWLLPDERVLTGHNNYVYSMAFSVDGLLATAGADDTVRLWDPTDSRDEVSRFDHSGDVDTVAFSPDGTTLAFAGAGGIVELHDVRGTDSPVYLSAGHFTDVRDLAYSPDGTLLAVAGGETTVLLLDVAEQQVVNSIEHPEPAYAVEFSPDGSLLATAAEDNVVRLWDPDEVARLERARREAEENGVEWSDAESTELRLEHPAEVYEIAFAPSGELLATAGEDGVVRLWDLATGQTLEESGMSHDAPVTALAFSPDGNVLATGSEDKLVRLWDVAAPAIDGTLVGEPLAGHTSTVYTVAFHPDGQLLASAGEDTVIRLWPVESPA